MKKILKHFRTKSSPENVAEIARISKTIGPLIENAVKEVFKDYSLELVNNPLTYIVPAVWGASVEGELSDSQKEIFLRINPVIESIIAVFEFKKLTQAQKFAMGYLIRGLLISKITFMVEATRNRHLDQDGRQECDGSLLNRMETIGTA